MIAILGLALWLGQVSPGQAAYERADRAFAAGKFAEAGAALDEALRLDAELVPALTLGAKLAMTMNRFDVARESLRRALRVAPGSAYVHFLAGLEAYLRNDLPAAQPEFERAHEIDPKDARAALYLGLIHESLGRTAEALKLYGSAESLETALAGERLLFLLDRPEECRLWLTRALRLGPQSRDAHFEAARLALRQNDPAGAVRHGELALRLAGETTDAQVHYVLSRAYFEAGDPSKAREHAAAAKR
ncbi:MAG: tetratricopeptide repeat protein [Acidobacteriota bacterium]|nr:tetratricopeptide repeat protein [Acidobacteriota bacterium]